MGLKPIDIDNSCKCEFVRGDFELPLFSGIEKRIGLRLTDTKLYSTGLVSVAYEVEKKKESKATTKVSAKVNE